jgi:hypothetical protein
MESAAVGASMRSMMLSESYCGTLGRALGREQRWVVGDGASRSPAGRVPRPTRPDRFLDRGAQGPGFA